MYDVEKLNDNDLICYCMEVDKKTIVDAIKDGSDTLKSIRQDTKASTGKECKIKNPLGRCCAKEVIQLIEIYADKKSDDSHSCCSNQ